MLFKVIVLFLISINYSNGFINSRPLLNVIHVEDLADSTFKTQDDTCRLVIERNEIKYLLIDALNDTSTCGTTTHPLKIVNPSNFTLEIIHYDFSPDREELSGRTPHEVEIVDPLASEKVLLTNGNRNYTGKFNFKTMGNSVTLSIKRGVNDSLSGFLLRFQVDDCPALSNDINLTMKRFNSKVIVEEYAFYKCNLECNNGSWVVDIETCGKRARNEGLLKALVVTMFISIVSLAVVISGLLIVCDIFIETSYKIKGRNRWLSITPERFWRIRNRTEINTWSCKNISAKLRYILYNYIMDLANFIVKFKDIV